MELIARYIDGNDYVDTIIYDHDTYTTIILYGEDSSFRTIEPWEWCTIDEIYDVYEFEYISDSVIDEWCNEFKECIVNAEYMVPTSILRTYFRLLEYKEVI